MLLANVLIGANKPALEDAEIALCCICVDGLALARTRPRLVVIHAFMFRHKAKMRVLVGLCAIRVQGAFRVNVTPDCVPDAYGVDTVQHSRADMTAALHKRNETLVARPRTFLAFARTADFRFVGFHNAPCAAQLVARGRGHSLTNTVCHEPRALVRDPQHPVELVSRYAFLARRHQVQSHHPLVQGDMRPLEYRASPNREFAPTGAAEEHA